MKQGEVQALYSRIVSRFALRAARAIRANWMCVLRLVWQARAEQLRLGGPVTAFVAMAAWGFQHRDVMVVKIIPKPHLVLQLWSTWYLRHRGISGKRALLGDAVTARYHKVIDITFRSLVVNFRVSLRSLLVFNMMRNRFVRFLLLWLRSKLPVNDNLYIIVGTYFYIQ